MNAEPPNLPSLRIPILALLLSASLAALCARLWAITARQALPPLPPGLCLPLASPRAAGEPRNAPMSRRADAADSAPRNIRIEMVSDRIVAWTNLQTVAVTTNGTYYTTNGMFADQPVSTTLRLQIISVTATNGLWTSTDLTNWTEVKPPGSAYSPNVVLVGSPAPGGRLFKTKP